MQAAATIGGYFGYYFIMLVFMILGIIFAKRRALGWILYAIGGGLQLLSLIGSTAKLARYGFGTSYLMPRWIGFVVILLVSGVIITVRHDKID